jgi:hypothetical protein
VNAIFSQNIRATRITSRSAAWVPRLPGKRTPPDVQHHAAADSYPPARTWGGGGKMKKRSPAAGAPFAQQQKARIGHVRRANRSGRAGRQRTFRSLDLRL